MSRSSNPSATNDLSENLSTLLSLLCRLDRLIRKNAKALVSGRKLGLQPELESLILSLNATIDLLADRKNQLNAYHSLIANLVRDTKFQVRTLERPILGKIGNAIDQYLHSTSVPAKILTGLILAIPLYIYTPIEIRQRLDRTEQRLIDSGVVVPNDDNLNPNQPNSVPEEELETLSQTQIKIIIFYLTTSFIVGATGSIISIITRLSDYREVEADPNYASSALPIYVGLFKPVIGGVFGILIYATLAADILPINLLQSADVGSGGRWLALISVTFVTGFSERLDKDLVGKVEETIISSDTPPDSSNAAEVSPASSPTEEAAGEPQSQEDLSLQEQKQDS